MQRQDVIDCAREYIGTRFILNGRDPKKGIDCGGILLIVAQQKGYHYKDLERRYTASPVRGSERLELLQENMRQVPIEELQPGMVLALRVLRTPIVQHLAIYTGPGPDGDGRMLHAWEEAGAVVESRVGKYWRERIVAVFDWVKEEDWKQEVHVTPVRG